MRRAKLLKKMRKHPLSRRAKLLSAKKPKIIITDTEEETKVSFLFVIFLLIISKK